MSEHGHTFFGLSHSPFSKEIPDSRAFDKSRGWARRVIRKWVGAARPTPGVRAQGLLMK